LTDLQRWSDLVFEAWRNERFVFVFGNGGSGLLASHICLDLGKGTFRNANAADESKKRLKVLSLTDNLGWITAVANDLTYDQVFLQQLMNYGSEGDLVIGISCSGNSPNVLRAIDWANRHGMTTFCLTGRDGGQLKRMQRFGVHIDLADIGMVESIHLGLFHWVLNDVHCRVKNAERPGPERNSHRTAEI
jgi:D-sedoheptulose 7-phosphate isomerase